MRNHGYARQFHASVPGINHISRTNLKLSVWLACATLLSLGGCGGGGSDSSSSPAPVASPISFPLQSGYRALVQSAQRYNFTMVGSCSGTSVETVTAATSNSTFEGAAALQSDVAQTSSRNNCAPQTVVSNTTTFLDPVTFLPLGSVTTGSEYVVAQARPAALPLTVKVGEKAAVVGFDVYSDSTKATLLGTRSATFTITSDTASTAFLTIITNDFSGSSLQSTQQTTYRMSIDGSLVLVSVDVVTITGTHLLLTRI